MELRSEKLTIETRNEAGGSPKREEWKRYKEETGNDFLIAEAERLMDLAGDDPEIKEGVYIQLVDMLFEFPKEHQRMFYLDLWGKKFKPAKFWKEEYAAQVKLRNEPAEVKNLPSLEADTFTLERFGFYTEGNKYWFATQSGFVEGTNFILEPLFHIYSTTNNRRLIRITNEYNYSLLCDVPSDAMVSVDKFQNFLYSEGNFLILCNNHQFKKLLRYLGEKFPKCHEIKTFGWQPEGFYAFADGAYNGKWQPVNAMGIVDHKGQNYFSPAFSEVYNQLRADDDVYENDRRFVYRKSELGLTQWSELMQRVYSFKMNGCYGVAYLCAALFRSHIYNLYKIFPHLFLHGEKGSGKSQLAWSLSNIFQHGTPPFNLSSGTDVAFFRWLARYRDVIIWYDEYEDSIDGKRFQALKSAYDGVGREKGKISRDSRTESDKINSAAMITGQHLPQRDDNSLYTRSIVLFFAKPKEGFSIEDMQDFDQLKRIEEVGLSQIITTLLDHRDIVIQKFARSFSDMFEYYKEVISKNKLHVDDRILRNYTILSTIVWLFQKETPLDLMIIPEEFREQCLNDAIEQSDKINNSDALGTFWRLFAGLVQNFDISGDYDIKSCYSVKITKKESGKTVQIEKGFNEKTRILYIDFDLVHLKYMDVHRRTYGTPGLGFQTIIDYSRNHMAYIGLCGSHYFDAGKGKRTSAYMFDYDLLVRQSILPEIQDPLNESDSF